MIKKLKIQVEQFAVQDGEDCKRKMLNWSARFNIFCLLDNNNYSFSEPAFDCVLAAGAHASLPLNNCSLAAIREFSQQHPGYLFGHLNYPGSIADPCGPIGFPAAFFFRPEILLRLEKGILTIESHSRPPQEIFEEFSNVTPQMKIPASYGRIQHCYSRLEYLNAIVQIKAHIQRGDCYELNFCQDFIVEEAETDPWMLFDGLNKLSPNPFAAFYRLGEKFCMCASPERFLQKSGSTVISQPIKGTSKRNLANSEADMESKQYLSDSPKERAENVMIVDLVRNDLSKVCLEGSVKVSELCGIYSFPQVHQMISTISGEVARDVHWSEILDACFPMGSMTGAPKVRVMQLINEYEKNPRELFSGCIGYIDPSGNFDFNVVIRSLFFNQAKKLLKFYAGGGITSKSEPEKEYEETMVKVSAILELLK